MNQDTKNKFAEMMAAHNKANDTQAAKKESAKEVKILGQTVKEGTKLHAKLIQEVKHFNDLEKNEINMPEMSEMTIADLLPALPPSPEPETKLKVVDYSEKAIAIIGDTYIVKDVLKRLGGRFNYNLTCGAGWIFSKAKADLLRKELKLTF